MKHNDVIVNFTDNEGRYIPNICLIFKACVKLKLMVIHERNQHFFPIRNVTEIMRVVEQNQFIVKIPLHFSHKTQSIIDCIISPVTSDTRQLVLIDTIATD